MTPLSPARRDAEAFAVAVEDRTAAVAGARGDVADRYADLLTCVDVLRAQDVPAPRADFVADLRMRLMDAADTLLVPAETDLAPVVPLHSPAAARRQRRISIAAAAFVVVGGTAGVAAAADNALPGDPLYPIKRGIESAKVSLSTSDSGKGQDLLRNANTRLVEAEALIAQDKNPAQITETLDSYEESATNGADLLFGEYQRNGDSEELSRLRAVLGSQLAKLDSLSSEAPSGTIKAFEHAKALLGDLDQQASVLCGNCGAGGISDRFSSASSPSLATLLNAPAINAQLAAAQAERNEDLADKADEIAKANQGKGDDKGGQNPTADPSAPTDGTQPPAVPPAPEFGGPLGGLTSGVTTLLEGVGAPLAPLTDAVGNTLEELTKGLLK
ncbi:hypothetical protein ABIE44_001337 [Marmoricola sp. OAE513]|uniref:DUF5667 domain-containing protein n=1 Tax=Marmoricola sp. OAE513 TaxID=2817894 RepID=UPI001AE6B691